MIQRFNLIDYLWKLLVSETQLVDNQTDDKKNIFANNAVGSSVWILDKPGF